MDAKLMEMRFNDLQNLFSFTTSDAAGGIDLDLTLRFPDHVALWMQEEEEKCSHCVEIFFYK